MSFNLTSFVVSRSTGDRANGLLSGRLTGRAEVCPVDLLGHFGCVNSVEFNRTGDLLASGGDDRRVLIWKTSEAIDAQAKVKVNQHGNGEVKGPLQVMKGQHSSNIFCIDFDFDSTRVYSAGNDEQVLVHDLLTQKPLDVFGHDDPIYGLSVHPENRDIFITACSGAKIQLFDLRSGSGSSPGSSKDPITIASYREPFHAAVFNPMEPRLIASANHHYGLELWDIRHPKKRVLQYGDIHCPDMSPLKCDGQDTSCAAFKEMQTQSAMSVRFDRFGSRVLGLRRRMPPVLFDLQDPIPLAEFDNPGYYNSCTMKTCSFAGENDEFVMSGSDDFNIYMWKIPGKEEETEEDQRTTLVDKAHLVLKGHRSIVNQVRYNYNWGAIASAGVEKVVKIWSVLPMPKEQSEEEVEKKMDQEGRRVYTRDEYIRLVLESGHVMTHDYSTESIEENAQMMAFFDSLVQREIEGSKSSSSDNSDSDTSPEEDNSDAQQDPSLGPQTRISDLISKKRRQTMRQVRLKRRRNNRIDQEHVRNVLIKAQRVLKKPRTSSSTSSSDTEEAHDISTSDSQDSSRLFDLLKSSPPSEETERMTERIKRALIQTSDDSSDDSSSDDISNRQSTSNGFRRSKASAAKRRNYRVRTSSDSDE